VGLLRREPARDARALDLGDRQDVDAALGRRDQLPEALIMEKYNPLVAATIPPSPGFCMRIKSPMA